MVIRQGLTRKQRNIYVFLINYKREKGKSPTLNEISKYTNKSKSTIHKMLQNMMEKGYIEVSRYKKRGIIIIDEVDYDKYSYDNQTINEEKGYIKRRIAEKNKQNRRGFWR